MATISQLGRSNSRLSTLITEYFKRFQDSASEHLQPFIHSWMVLYGRTNVGGTFGCDCADYFNADVKIFIMDYIFFLCFE